ncbi:MAG: hypothetical protein MI892_24150 [Desulfobacterales bacterium]|nr:hypothetical protein [Desulfobacterales bacterium]
MTSEMNQGFQDREEKRYVAEGEMKYVFSMLGDTIAKDQGYEDLRGMEAVYRYLIDKYHWLPHQVRSLSVEDLSLLLDGYRKPESPDVCEE